MRQITILSILPLFLLGCEVYKQDDYRQQYVVDAWLTALDPFAEIHLTTTIPVDAVYNPENLRVSGAAVTILEYDEGGTFVKNITYNESPGGTYIPEDPSLLVSPLYRYELDITIPVSNHKISAFTIVPDTFSIQRFNSLELPYQGSVQFEADVSRSFYPGRQTIYIVSTNIINPNDDDLTPFWSNADGEPSEFYTVSSGLINEGNYDINPDNTITIRYPWIGIAFYGSNQLNYYAVDDNVYDFIRSAQVQLGGSTLSPGEIDNVIYNVTGGIGVFGSFSATAQVVTVTR